MNFLDNIFKRNTIKQFEEISKIQDDLDDISIIVSTVISKLSNVESTISNLTSEKEAYLQKINIALYKKNIPLAKRALEKSLLLDKKLLFYKKYDTFLLESKSKIYLLLNTLQEQVDLSLKIYENRENGEIKKCIKEYYSIKEDLNKYLDEITTNIPLDKDYSITNDIDIEFEFNKYIIENNIII